MCGVVEGCLWSIWNYSWREGNFSRFRVSSLLRYDPSCWKRRKNPFLPPVSWIRGNRCMTLTALLVKFWAIVRTNCSTQVMIDGQRELVLDPPVTPERFCAIVGYIAQHTSGEFSISIVWKHCTYICIGESFFETNSSAYYFFSFNSRKMIRKYQ